MAVEKKKIVIVGCGPGAADYITPAAEAAAAKAEVLIVSQRLKGLFPGVAAERIDSGTDVDGILEIMASRRDEGLQTLEKAVALNPDAWSMWRQMADLDTVGKSGGPEFWARVRALGDKRYYAAVDMPGEP